MTPRVDWLHEAAEVCKSSGHVYSNWLQKDDAKTMWRFCFRCKKNQRRKATNIPLTSTT